MLVTDAPKDHHGKGESFSPSDLLSVSLGSCILSIMAIAANSSGLDINGSTATVTKEMADNPRRIAKISVTVAVPVLLDSEQKARLQAAAHACPVHHALGIDAPILFNWKKE